MKISRTTNSEIIEAVEAACRTAADVDNTHEEWLTTTVRRVKETMLSVPDQIESARHKDHWDACVRNSEAWARVGKLISGNAAAIARLSTLPTE